jgi:transcriptional regulator with XRE-family HTH domain
MKYYNVKETASRIRDLRIKCGYSQTQAAKLLEIDRSHLSRIESGEKVCSVDIFLGIAELYHVSLDELLQNEHSSKEMCRETLDKVIAQLEALRKQL